MALGPTLDAKHEHDADQVLFATHDDITETGASNFFLCDEHRLITRALDDSFLHGVTRDSVIKLAARIGYEVEERQISVSELTEWARQGGEVFLSGTAAVVAPVGTVIVGDSRVTVGDGTPGPNTLKLREALTSIHSGSAEDPFGWMTKVEG
jgi:branched-chain amino acid aminotransferase